MADKWDTALEGLPDETPVTPPQADIQQNAKPKPAGKWDTELAALDANQLMQDNPGFTGSMKDFFRFTGQGTLRGAIAENFGMPADSVNALASWFETHPGDIPRAASIPIAAPLVAPAALKSVVTSQPLPGGTKDIRSAMEGLGLPTATPKEEGNTSSAAYWGDIMGEFGGANLPFVLGAPAKIIAKEGPKLVPNIIRILKSDEPIQTLLKEIGLGAVAPGSLAGVGAEAVGPQHEDIGKMAGALAGNIRMGAVDTAMRAARGTSAWLHDFIGLGTGAPTKVGEALTRTAQDLPSAVTRAGERLDLSPGAQLPVDIKTGDEGLMALRRTVVARDAELAGDYQGMQRATEAAIKADAQLSPANFPDTESWLTARQKALEDLTNKRLLQATQEAEQATEQAFRGVETAPMDSTVAKNKYATALRRELLNARDDLDAVTQAAWKPVDKTQQVEMAPVYDTLSTMQAEHAARRGEPGERYPSKFLNQFFDEAGDAKFGPGSTLQDVIDLDSAVQQELRTQAAKDAPDRVYNAYLKRLSESLNQVKYNLPGADSVPALKNAINATKNFHETFSRGPVGEVLGFDAAGGLDISPGETIKHFLGQGPAGIDAFNALMRGVQARTGAVAQVHPTVEMPGLLEKYIRQDFFDNTMANGTFSNTAAQKWFRNNAGPLNAFPDLQKEFSNAIRTEGQSLPQIKQEVQKSLSDIRGNRAQLFLDGKPGQLFNGALNTKGADQYRATRELVAMTKGDPTGRATEGLAQMALDRMLSAAIVPDRSTSALQRINGLDLANWVETNRGVIRALDEALPGIGKRFERIAETGRYLERFQVEPKLPKPDEMVTGPWLRDVVARVTGANVFQSMGLGGGSIQTAAIGSQAFKKLAAAMTPDQATELLRRALLDEKLFTALVTAATPKNDAQKMQRISPYFYSIGVPLSQPVLNPPERRERQPASAR